MSRIDPLHQLGQSLWYDNIQRRLLEDGTFARMIADGDIRGVTSNPSIFHAAIAKTSDYDAALKPMAWSGWSAEQIFDQLAIEDIQQAADLFRPLYDSTRGGDGYVSLEVSPYLAKDAEGTISEARRLWKLVARPNLMIKIPATQECIPAVRATIADGINVNVTLIFALDRYEAVMDAYLGGLEERAAKGLPVDKIASVASFFVSRVDTKIDARLKEIGTPAALELQGKAAIANARLAYALFLKTFGSERFAHLKSLGANLQRPLWASTSTKNPAYRDVIYIEELIGPDSVNTVPPQTLDAFREHGETRVALSTDVKAEQDVITRLADMGIHMAQVTRELEDEGVKSFADAFTAMIKTIEERRASAQAELGDLKTIIPARIDQLQLERAAERMASFDPTFWTNDESVFAETKKRLGWLKAPEKSLALIPQVTMIFEEARHHGLTHVLLLGMGGSSLAPEVMRLVMGVQNPGLDLAILDSTDPGQVKAAAERSDPAHTLYIVASKSGSTSEVNAFMDYFWAAAHKSLGDKAPRHFVAITDPGTSLEKLAIERGFSHVVTADPNVGGRYSALIAFGVLPAALLGLDVAKFLGRAQWMASQSLPETPAGRNPGLVLGAILGEAALHGKDKVTVLTDPELVSFGSWMEQLVAESTGKHGKGIVPVDIEPELAPENYGKDRLFVYLSLNGKNKGRAAALLAAGHPVLTYELASTYDLAAEFYRWEIATAVACAVLGVCAFDQPNVQDSKTRTQQKIQSFREHGALQEGVPAWEGEGGWVFGPAFSGLDQATKLSEVVSSFLQQVKPGDYVAINAYVPRNDQTLADLQTLRKAILDKTHVATTLGFGPRFLHSTGQLHKGGADNGVFLQITAEPTKDIDIPEEGLTFGTLERAQALGDLEALLARGRRAVRIHLHGGTISDLIPD